MDELRAKNQLIEHFKKSIDLSEKEEGDIRAAYQIKHLTKKDYFFKEGSCAEYEGYVVKGTLRVFNTDSKGLEHVLYFAFSDWWVGDITSLYLNESSGLNSQALEDSTLLVIQREEKERLFEKVPKLERVFRILVQKHLAVLQKRFLLTIGAHAEERYLELLERCPGIEQLIPQHQIASYLGILPESLSRMKKQMQLNKKS